MLLKFEVENQDLTRINYISPVSDSINYLKAKFYFKSSDWNKTEKTVIFQLNDDEPYTVILDSEEMCLVPKEVTNVGILKISLYGTKEDYRITTNPIIVYLRESGYKDGETPVSPSFPLYEQILTEINKKGDTLQYENNVLKLLSKDKELSSVFIQNGSSYNGSVVEKSNINGNIIVDGKELVVYVLPSSVVQDDNYIHTDNNFTEEYKINIDTNTLNRHNHSNKDILDNITANYTLEEKQKLQGIEPNAQVNINANWNSDSGDSKILNKPTNLSDFNNDEGFISNNVTNLTNYYTTQQVDNLLSKKVSKENGKGLSTNDFTNDYKNQVDNNTLTRHTHDNKDILDNTTESYTTSDKDKLNSISYGANINVKPNWNETNQNDDSFILNKPTKLSEFENDNGFITSSVNNLTNYYNKSNSYNKDEINSIINNVSSISILVVDELPTTNIKTNVFYFVSKSSGTVGDEYDEYVNLDGTSDGWERIGSVNTGKIDLSDYYTKSQTDSLLDKKVDIVEGKTLSTNDFSNEYKNKVDDNTLSSHTHSNKNILDNVTASYTIEDKTKLDGIQVGAEINVQSDWNETNSLNDDYIKNKPISMPASDVYDWAKEETKPNYDASEISGLSNVATSGNYNDLNNIPSIPSNMSDLVNDEDYVTDKNYTHTDNNFTNNYKSQIDQNTLERHSHSNKSILDNITASYTIEEQNKLNSIQNGAEVNVNADWNSVEGESKILNKPTKLSSFDNDENFITNDVNNLKNYYTKNETNILVDKKFVSSVSIENNILTVNYNDGTSNTFSVMTYVE